MMLGNWMAVDADLSMQYVTSRNRMYYLIHIQPAASPSSPPLYIEMTPLMRSWSLVMPRILWVVDTIIYLGTQRVSGSQV